MFCKAMVMFGFGADGNFSVILSKVILYWKYLLFGTIVVFKVFNVAFLKYVVVVLSGPTKTSPEHDESSQLLTWALILPAPLMYRLLISVEERERFQIANSSRFPMKLL